MREPGTVGEAAEGSVRVELDAGGMVRDVVVEQQAMTMSARQLSEALVTAFQAAQDAARESAQQYGDLPSRERLQAAADEATANADCRFEEISTALYDLTRRAERAW